MTMTLPTEQVVIPTLSRAQRMRATQKTTKLTQKKFTKQINIKHHTMTHWEREEGPAPKSILLLVQMRTKVPMEWLLNGWYTPRGLNPEPTDFGSVIVGPWASAVAA